LLVPPGTFIVGGASAVAVVVGVGSAAVGAGAGVAAGAAAGGGGGGAVVLVGGGLVTMVQPTTPSVMSGTHVAREIVFIVSSPEAFR